MFQEILNKFNSRSFDSEGNPRPGIMIEDVQAALQPGTCEDISASHSYIHADEVREIREIAASLA